MTIDARHDNHVVVLDRLAMEVGKKPDKDDVDTGFAEIRANFDRVFGALDTIIKTLETRPRASCR